MQIRSIGLHHKTQNRSKIEHPLLSTTDPPRLEPSRSGEPASAYRWALVGLPVFLVAFLLSLGAVTEAGTRRTTYYRFGTTDWQTNVPVATSTDLIHWQPAPDALPALSSWAADSISMTWAPAVVVASGRYVLLVTSEEPRRDLRGWIVWS